jgi:rare lipoprotein A
MSSISCVDEPMVSSAGIRKAVQLFALAITAAMLAACASSPTTISNTASVTGSQQAALQPDPKASVVTNRRVAVVTKKHMPVRPAKPAAKTQESYGIASFYEEDGTQTASGEQFDGHKLTAAHRTLPFGTRVRVTNVASGNSVTVRINDRGPFIAGRVIDVSYSAAKTLGITERGIAMVKLDIVH